MAGASAREVSAGAWSQLWTGLSPGRPVGAALVGGVRAPRTLSMCRGHQLSQCFSSPAPPLPSLLFAGSSSAAALSGSFLHKVGSHQALRAPLASLLRPPGFSGSSLGPCASPQTLGARPLLSGPSTLVRGPDSRPSKQRGNEPCWPGGWHLFLPGDPGTCRFPAR